VTKNGQVDNQLQRLAKYHSLDLMNGAGTSTISVA